MPEDEFDFAGQNPAEHLPLDTKATPFDYAARLRLKSYTQTSPPDIGGLFQALATPYVPTRVVHLPPKVVQRVRVTDVLLFPVILFFCLLVFLSWIGIFVGFPLALGVYIPYKIVDSYNVKLHLRPGAMCTITDTYVTSSSDDSGTTYSPVIDFTLRTPNGKSYPAYEYWPSSSYNQEADAQQYLSRFQIQHTYSCWYNTQNPGQASFFEQTVGFWDIFWLFVSAILFPVCGILPMLLYLRFLGGVVIHSIRGGRARSSRRT